jgi:hypothetical protein
MRKTDKKLDNQIIEALTDVCDNALKQFEGFQWLTHLVDYSRFPKSLQVVCVFETNDELSDFVAAKRDHEFNLLIQKSLSKIGINIVSRQVSFDTEENCKKANGGKWADRFSNQMS